MVAGSADSQLCFLVHFLLVGFPHAFPPGPVGGPVPDGNTRNGDGCSSVCQVEANWECPGPRGRRDPSLALVGIRLLIKVGDAPGG